MEDGLAIAALGFALCRAPNRVEGRLCAGMTGLFAGMTIADLVEK